MEKRHSGAVMLVAGMAIAAAAHAKDFEVAQKNKKFSQTNMSVQVGDSIGFKNEDPFMHNIFSLSDVKTFDLGSYPQGEARKVTFDKPGSVEIECAIHPEMKLTVEVKK